MDEGKHVNLPAAQPQHKAATGTQQSKPTSPPQRTHRQPKSTSRSTSPPHLRNPLKSDRYINRHYLTIAVTLDSIRPT